MLCRPTLLPTFTACSTGCSCSLKSSSSLAVTSRRSGAPSESSCTMVDMYLRRSGREVMWRVSSLTAFSSWDLCVHNAWRDQHAHFACWRCSMSHVEPQQLCPYGMHAKLSTSAAALSPPLMMIANDVCATNNTRVPHLSLLFRSLLMASLQAPPAIASSRYAALAPIASSA